MSEQRTLLIGIDLAHDFTQVSYWNEKEQQVDSLYVEQAAREDMIPTALAVTAGTKEWLIGWEAVECAEAGRGQLVTGFLGLEGEPLTIYGTEFNRAALLERYLRKVLLLVKRFFPEEAILRVVVTTRFLAGALSEDLYFALENLGIFRDRARIISYEQSFLYFALSQKKELWMNDVALFDYSDLGLLYTQMSVDRRNKPMVVGVSTKDYSEPVPYDLVVTGNMNLPYLFEQVSQSVMHKQIISTVYLTGKGFEGEWIQHSLGKLCTGRRVFVGQNLYSYGACYAAREDVTGINFSGFAFLSAECIPYSVSMQLYTGGTKKEMLLVETATPWYDVKRKLHVIVEDEEELQFIFRDIFHKSKETRIVPLEGIGNRMSRGTRLELRLSATQKKDFIITVKDMGFGEFCPSSHRIWEKVIAMGERN